MVSWATLEALVFAKGFIMDTVALVLPGGRATLLTKSVTRLAAGVSFTLLVATQATAQYGGGGGMGGNPGSGTYTAPAGGYSSAKGAGIGAGVAAGAGILFLTLHYRGRVTGCVQPGDDGLRSHDRKKNRSYALDSGEAYLKPGQLVELQGHKSKNQAGAETFTAQKLIKDLGTCGTPSTVTPRGTGTH